MPRGYSLMRDYTAVIADWFSPWTAMQVSVRHGISEASVRRIWVIARKLGEVPRTRRHPSYGTRAISDPLPLDGCDPAEDETPISAEHGAPTVGDDLLLARLRAAHGESRADIPPELIARCA